LTGKGYHENFSGGIEGLSPRGRHGGKSIVKLHLGCGPRYIPGFKHIDIVPHDHVDVVTTVDNLFMIQDASVELIYACHVLEHFNRVTRAKVLQEWFRVLQPGGILRIAVPDFEVCARLYLEGKASIPQIHGPILGGQTYLYNFHYAIYDFTVIREVLESSGFTDVRRYDWRTTGHADVDDFSQAYLPHMDKENGTLISLNVEAVKPGSVS
jgi:predicted SAM-dependent methyltransferase